MVSCSACGISHRSVKNGIRFHRFPKNTEQRNAWLRFTGKSENDIAKVSYLCSQHFGEEQFDRTSSYKVQLRSNAVPTKAVFRSKYSKDMEQTVILPATADGEVLSVIVKDEIDIEEHNLNLIKQEIDEEKVMVIKQEYANTDYNIDNEQGGCSSNNNNNIAVPHDCSSSSNYTATLDNFGITDSDSTLVLELKKQVQELAAKDKLKSKQIRQLQKINWTQKKKISQLLSMIKEIQKEYSVQQEQVLKIIGKLDSSEDLIDEYLDENGD
ncbi:hypothetical protein ILUMI_20617 [Ignelater luminosus]|uniref:THAP-type domain-containing protein n=1 Tax=Ignelater luminosus TaxID=2038154 RepID=A0A8K0CDY7_IGNLU|nr:hypothetical protein ILUMI_20617 [Ignelater luminosus]